MSKQSVKPETRGDLVIQLTARLTERPEHIPYVLGYLLGSTDVDQVRYLLRKVDENLADADA